MVRKVDFVWELPGWRWEATHYEGHGIFFGKVTSPIVPEGEFGTWYVWEIQGIGAHLVKGDAAKLAELLKPAKKDMQKQQAFTIRSELEGL